MKPLILLYDIMAIVLYKNLSVVYCFGKNFSIVTVHTEKVIR